MRLILNLAARQQLREIIFQLEPPLAPKKMARKRIVKLCAINLLYNFIIARTFAEILGIGTKTGKRELSRCDETFPDLESTERLKIEEKFRLDCNVNSVRATLESLPACFSAFNDRCERRSRLLVISSNRAFEVNGRSLLLP